MTATPQLATTAAVGLAALAAMAVAGCGGSSVPTPTGTPQTRTPPSASPSASAASTCSPPAGGRCAGPRPVDTTLSVDGSGLHLRGVFLCGGTLSAEETSTRVTVVYRASAVGRGALSCARVPSSVTLHQPLGNRPVVDGTTGQRVTVSHG